MSIIYYQEGLSVADLKELLEGWPDKNDDGSENRIYVTVNPGNYSLVNVTKPIYKGDLLLEVEMLRFPSSRSRAKQPAK